MNRYKFQSLVIKPLFMTAVILLATGCQTIVRENIISSIDTGVGATVAENKQTQMYELKAGYIRSQFYSIPTGKLVENTNANSETSIVTNPGGNTTNAKISNAANITPQVVSGIKEHSGLGDLLLGMDVSENFAVGDVAVMSPAAVAMYIANADTDAKAQAASEVARQQVIKSFQISATNAPALAAQAKQLIDEKATNAETFKTTVEKAQTAGLLTPADATALETGVDGNTLANKKEQLKTFMIGFSTEAEASLKKFVDLMK